MSRLHDMKVIKNTSSNTLPEWFLKPIVRPILGQVTPERKRYRTMKKTAAASGHYFTPLLLGGWRTRKQGASSTKSTKSQQIKVMRKQAIAASKGDIKKA